MLNINFLLNRKKIFIICLVLLFILFFCFSDYGFIKRIELELEAAKLEKIIIQQNQTTDSIQAIIEKLQFDEVEIERIAREEYGMIKPNEDVYYIKK